MSAQRVATALLFACVAMTAQAQQGTVSPMGPGQVRWLISSSAYSLLLQQGSTAASLAAEYFGNPETFFIVNSSTDLSTVPAGSIPTASYTSFAAMQLGVGDLSPHIQAVIYDSENWPFTPTAEQQKPSYYYQLASQLLHQHGLLLIATPAIDLVKSLEPDYQGSIYAEFIRLKLAEAVARYADVYEIQAQGSETDLGLFTEFVAQASAQAKAANPQATILAGISTNPSGQAITSDQLFASVGATLGVDVSGYWLNIPAASPYCPACGAPQPQVAVGLLQQMAGSIGYPYPQHRVRRHLLSAGNGPRRGWPSVAR